MGTILAAIWFILDASLEPSGKQNGNGSKNMQKSGGLEQKYTPEAKIHAEQLTQS